MEENHEEHDKQTMQAIKANIEEYGCHLALIEADNYMPAFAYSIGLFEKFQHPEICCFGLSTQVMGQLINHLASMIKDGLEIELDRSYPRLIKGYDIRFIEVRKEHFANNFGYGGWYYKNFDFPMLQMIWPDKENKLPWEEGFNPEWKFKQPLLDRNTDFFFYEERNLGVFTTQDVLEGVPILHIYHNEDGDWQFHSSTSPQEKDAKLVSLEELVKLDPSINDVYYLEYGAMAHRASKDDEWMVGDNNKN